MVEPLTEQELRQLETYSEEHLRGLVHTKEWEMYITGLEQRWLSTTSFTEPEKERFKVVKP